MTPEEKGKELFNKFSFVVLPDHQSVRTASIISKAKQCALICVDEIIAAFPYHPNSKHLYDHIDIGFK